MSTSHGRNGTTDVLALERRGYRFGKKIGKGSYGSVVCASYHDLQSNSKVDLACKYVNKKKAPEDFLQKFFPREIQFLTQISHPNIIKIHSILQSGETVFIFMRYAENGDLLEYIKKNGPIQETQSNLWFYQMASAIQYLHAMDIAHRDLKCENILITKHMNLKLADFGFARSCVDINEQKVFSETYCGSAELDSITSITVSPDLGLNTTTTKAPPTKATSRPIMLPIDKPMKINNTTLLSGETLETAADNRYRRLVPYMTFYIPTNDYNYPLNHQLYQQQGNQYKQQNVNPTQAVYPSSHPKLHQQQQIPPIGLLYGVNQGKVNRPVAQAGFLLKPRPDVSPSYRPYQIPVAVQVPQAPVPPPPQPSPQPAPQHSQPSINSPPKYQSVPILNQKPPPAPLKKHFTPFLPSNKLPGHFLPIVHNTYNNYDENLLQKSPGLANVRYQSIPEENLNNNINSYEDEDDFLPVKPTYEPALNHHVPSYYQNQEQVIYGTKRPPTVNNKYVYQEEPVEQEYQDEYPVHNGQNQYILPLHLHQVKPTQASPLHTSTFVPTQQYHSTPAPPIISSTTPNYPPPIQNPVTSTHSPYLADSSEYRDEPVDHYPSPPPANYPSPPPSKTIYHQVTTLSPISHNHIKPTTFSPDKYYESYKHINVKESPRYYSQIKQEPKIKVILEPVELEKPSPTPYVVPIHPTPEEEFQPGQEPHPSPDGEEYQLNQKPLPDLGSSSLADILRKLQESNHLPKTLTPDNIDNSIKTLVKILNNLKSSQVTRVPEHNQVHVPQPNDDYDYSEYDSHQPEIVQTGEPGPNTGRPGIDYPIYHEIPQSNFSCKEQRYKGFFGDPETGCQSWHYCDLNGGQASFLCPNGTIFSQVALTCDWWYNVKCASTAQLYVLNERLYKFILPFTPKFPEDYSGPLVDKYLALKFEEMEEKMRKQKEKGRESNEKEQNGQASSQESMKSESSEEITLKTELNTLEGLEGIKLTPAPIITSESTTQYTTPIPTIPAKLQTNIQAIPPKLPPIPKTQVESQRLEVIEIKTDGNSGHLRPLEDRYEERK